MKTINKKNSMSKKTGKCSERIINLIIVDESGSMISIYDEAFNGLNRTIANIKSQAYEIDGASQYINLITFNSGNYNQILYHCRADKADFINSSQYRPSGSTPLYDAIGRAVTGLSKHITDNDAVLVTIITDGEENSSLEYSSNDIKNLINAFSEKGWIFTFIGANQDVMYESGKIGIHHAISFTADSKGTDEMWEKESNSRSNFYKRMKSSRSNGISMTQFLHDESNSPDNFFEK